MARNDSGMTLMEMLIVIAILGMLLSMVLPVGGRLDNDAKQEETIHLLESIRFALIGAENAYDENGNRVIGGYVGDFGKLPDLIKHDWDTSAGEWSIPKKDGANEPEMTENTSYNDNGMPMVLWTNSIKVDGVSDPVLLAGNGWNGPYMASTRDDYPDDDDLFTHTASSPNSDELEENRKFLLRQGKGRLVDGWGSSLLVYKKDEDLYFVSAGSDRRIDFGKEDGSDEGPVDMQFSANEDNLIMILTNEQWNLTDQKTAQTMLKLKDLKAAILGRSGRVTDGVSQPNGYAVDMGGLETLMGAYVYKEGSTTVYECIRRHDSTSSTSPPNTTYWSSVGDTTSHPYASKWQDSSKYHQAQWHLLLMNADYVEHDETHYRCVGKDVAGPPSPSSSDWVEDDTFAGYDWVKAYTSGRTYNDTSGGVLNQWTYNSVVSFGAGWRGPYISYDSTPFTDAWGNEIKISVDHAKGSLTFTSEGPDANEPSPGADDDIVITIVRSDYAVPVTVLVKSAAAASGTNSSVDMNDQTSPSRGDYVSIYRLLNGDIVYADAFISSANAGDGNDGLFKFTNNSGYAYGPHSLGGATDITAGLGESATTTDSSWIPIGWATIVYRSKAYYNGQADSSHASPNPNKIKGESSGAPGPPGYQKVTIIHPRTSPQIVLGN